MVATINSDTASAARMKKKSRGMVEGDTLLSAVAQRRGDRVDRELNPLANPRVVLAGAVPFQQLDLEQIQRLDVGQAQADRGLERRMLFEQPRLLRDPEQRVVGQGPGVANTSED